jgi:hypothetical protein
MENGLDRATFPFIQILIFSEKLSKKNHDPSIPLDEKRLGIQDGDGSHAHLAA